MSPYLLYLDGPQGHPEGEGARVENRPGRRRTSQRTTKTGRKTTPAPSPAGLFCAPPSPSIINMYLFFHFNLDCATEQTPACPGRVGRGRTIRPRRVGGTACVCVRCVCVAYDRIARNYAVPACPVWFTFGFW